MTTIPVLHADEIEEDLPMPSINHSIVAQNLGGLLFAFRQKVSTHQQLNLNLGGWQTIPDLCSFPREDMPRDWLSDADECHQCPSLVIEILSPKQNLQPLIDKARRYLQHGAATCWIILPAARSILVLPATGPSSTLTEGELKDPRLGITIPVAEVFA
jgi:Uma2 family endonuclease